MPMMLFWLPTIFIEAFFELARIACESTERSLALSGGAMLPRDPKEAYVVHAAVTEAPAEARAKYRGNPIERLTAQA
jgi:hypothetical protein